MIPLWFSKPKKAIGLDIGTHSVKAVQLSRSGGRLCIDEVGYSLVDRNEVNANPVLAHANAVRNALKNMVLPQALVVAALTGQTAVIRYPRITEVSRDKVGEAVQKEAGQSIPYDLNEVFLDWAPLDEIREAEAKQIKVLLVAAKHEVINSRLQILEAAEVKCGVIGVDSLALADAAEACGFFKENESVALVDIGLTSSSIHFVKDGISNFIRDVSWGTRELIQAIAKERHCDYEEAERQLQGMSQPEASPAPEPAPAPAQAPEGTAESEIPISKPAEALSIFDDPFGEPVRPPASPVPSPSPLEPLDEELGFGGMTARPSMAPAAYGMDQEVKRDLREVLRAPLARMVSEIRRSFDFYEHQLYERPVERLLLSGGVARIPLVGETLMDELGVNEVEVVDPTGSALMLSDDISMMDLRERPSQFVVALGLAARGMADL